MNKIIEFLKTKQVFFVWTISYILVLWFLLYFLFNFNLFSHVQLYKLLHAHLTGFAGLLFGTILCLSIPLYIATSAIIIRDKKTIIEIPFIKKLFAKKTPEQNTEEKTEEIIETTSENIFPDDLPHELRVPFLRAKQHMSNIVNKTSVFNKQQTINENQIENPISEDIMPLPTDFDIEDTESSNIPNFTDIDFDADINQQTISNSVTKFLDQQNIEYESVDDFIITDNLVIYTHSDKDFWVVDENNWFATGKQKESPVQTLLLIAKQEQLTPIIYLEATNIMNLNDVVQDWENNGIIVVTNIQEITKIKK